MLQTNVGGNRSTSDECAGFYYACTIASGSKKCICLAFSSERISASPAEGTGRMAQVEKETRPAPGPGERALRAAGDMEPSAQCPLLGARCTINEAKRN